MVKCFYLIKYIFFTISINSFGHTIHVVKVWHWNGSSFKLLIAVLLGSFTELSWKTLIKIKSDPANKQKSNYTYAS